MPARRPPATHRYFTIAVAAAGVVGGGVVAAVIALLILRQKRARSSDAGGTAGAMADGRQADGRGGEEDSVVRGDASTTQPQSRFASPPTAPAICVGAGGPRTLRTPHPLAYSSADGRPTSPVVNAARQGLHPQLRAARSPPSATAPADTARPSSLRASPLLAAHPAPLAALRTEEVGDAGDTGSPKRAWSFTSPRVAPLPPAAGAAAAASHATAPPATATATPPARPL
jgi:hypothetical protein